MIFFQFFFPKSFNCKLLKINYNSEITIKIKGNGTQSIINNKFHYTPDKIYINGIGQNYTRMEVFNLNNEENTIKIQLNKQLTFCQEMFLGLSNITEIDLSKFDSSCVKNTSMMFANCSSLKSLNFTNFTTSLISNMEGMFCNCSSLTSLDLGNFKTKSLQKMGSMFLNCHSLKTINISNFDTSNVDDMDSLFKGCHSLTSLDISNFDISKVDRIKYMFYDCNSLLSLDLSNFISNKVAHIFDLYNTDEIIICFKDKNLTFITKKLYKYKDDTNFKNNCSNIYFNMMRKIIDENKGCCILNK